MILILSLKLQFLSKNSKLFEQFSIGIIIIELTIIETKFSHLPK
jgi:hypothetical protein